MGALRDLFVGVGFNFDKKALDKADAEVDDFKSNVSGMNKTFKSAEESAKVFQSQSTGTFTTLKKKAGAGVKKLEEHRMKLGAMFTGGAFAIGGMVKQAADFELAMTEVSEIMQASTEETELLIDAAKRMGIETKFSAREAAEGQKFLAKAGFDTQQTLASLPHVLNLAAGAEMDLGNTSDIVSDMMTGFGMAAEETGRIVDVLQYAANNANTDVSQLGGAFEQVGPVAKNLGFSLEETTATLSAMADAGIKGGKSGRYLRNIMNSMAGPTNQAQEKMKELGISFTDSQGEMNSMATIIADLNSRLGGMTKAQKQATLATLFGKEASTGMLVAINKGSKGIAGFTQELEGSAGAAENMADEKMATLSGAMTELRGSIGTAAINFGEKLTPAIQVTAKALTWLTNIFNKMPNWLQGTIAVVTTLTVGIIGIGAAIGFIAGPVATFFALFTSGGAIATAVGWMGATALPAIGTALATVGSVIMGTAVPAVVAFTTALLANPITWIVAGVVGLGLAIYGLVKHWDTVKQKTMDFFNWFKPGLKALAQPFKFVAGKIVGFFSNIDIVGSMIQGIEDKKDALFSKVKGVAKKVRDFLPFSPAKEGPLADLDKTGPGFINTIATGIEDNKGHLTNVVSGITGGVKQLFGGLFNNKKDKSKKETIQNTNVNQNGRTVHIENIEIVLPGDTDANNFEGNMEQAVRKVFSKIISEEESKILGGAY